MCEMFYQGLAAGRVINSCTGFYLCKIEVLELPNLKLCICYVKLFLCVSVDYLPIEN